MTPRRILPPLLACVAFATAACGGGGTQGNPATTTPPPATTGEAVDLTQAIRFHEGQAQVQVTGDVTESFTAALDTSSAGYTPAGGGDPAEIVIDWQAENGFLFRIDFDVTDGTTIDRTWAAAGVPGTSISDENYFPDFFSTKCEGEIARFNASGLEGSVQCADLTNDAETKTVDLQTAFTATV